MRLRSVLFTLLLASTLALAADGPTLRDPVRVIRLDAFDTQEATTLLRAEIQIRRLAELRDLDAIVVADTAEQLDRAEALLRERNAVASVATPHDPVPFEPRGEKVTRAFRLDGMDPKSAATLLRSIYVVREIELEENGLSIRATQAEGEAIETLLLELDVLAE